METVNVHVWEHANSLRIIICQGKWIAFLGTAIFYITHTRFFTVVGILQKLMSSLRPQSSVWVGENNVVSFKVEWAVWVGWEVKAE